jgi:hypothetical protein
MPEDGAPDQRSSSGIQDLVIDLGDIGPERPRLRQRILRRPTRQAMGTAAIFATAAMMFAAFAVGEEPGPSAVGPEISASSPRQSKGTTPEFRPRLIVPGSATPGERLIILGYRKPNLCGPAEVRFDGSPVPHEIIWYVSRTNAAYIEFFMSMDVPRSAKVGIHEIQLLGPVQSVRGLICTEGPERQSMIATTKISIVSGPDS